MTNADKAATANNLRKEQMKNEPFEIVKKQENYFENYIEKVENEEIISEVICLLIKRGLSYREANGVLYYADKALQEKSERAKLL